MKKHFVSAVSIIGLALAGQAWAQESGAPADVNYDCSLYDECGSATEAAPADERGETRGWNFGGRAAGQQSGGWNFGGGAAKAAPATKAVTKTAAVAPRAQAPASAAAPKAGLRRPAPVSPAMSAKAIRAMAGQRLTFVLGSADLQTAAKAELERLADAMKKPGRETQRFMVEGHTDAIGTRKSNLDLSKRRAQAVADYLVVLGVARDRLDVNGLGFDRPLEGLPATSAANRRVETRAIK